MLFCFVTTLVLLVISIIANKKNRLFTSVISVILLGIIFAYCNDISDKISYRIFYDKISFTNIDYVNFNQSSALFSYLICFFKMIGLDFDSFRLVIFIGLLVFLVLSCKKNVIFEFFVLFYASTIFFLDIVQLRFFVAEIILLIGVINYSYGRKKTFIICLFAVLFIHSMLAVFAFIFLLPRNKTISNSEAKKLFAVSAVLLIFLSINGRGVSLLQQYIGNLSIFNEYSNYFIAKVNNGYLLYLVYQVLNVSIAYFVNSRFQQLGEDISCDTEWNISFNTVNYNLQIIGMFFVISTMININFGRFFRIFTLINMLNLGSYTFISRKERINKCGDVYGKWSIISYEDALLLIIFVGLVLVWVYGETAINHSVGAIFFEIFRR